MYRAGISAILSQLVREARLSVVETFTVDAPKTGMLARKIKAMGLENVLIVTDEVDDNLYLSARNLPHVGVVAVRSADPVSLIRYDRVLITRGAVAKLEEMLS
jgi:large subunit ribosomal protein L4